MKFSLLMLNVTWRKTKSEHSPTIIIIIYSTGNNAVNTPYDFIIQYVLAYDIILNNKLVSIFQHHLSSFILITVSRRIV